MAQNQKAIEAIFIKEAAVKTEIDYDPHQIVEQVEDEHGNFYSIYSDVVQPEEEPIDINIDSQSNEGKIDNNIDSHSNEEHMDKSDDSKSEDVNKHRAKNNRNGTVVWSRDETLKLINCLELKPILWNFTMKEYQSKAKKEAAFAEVAEIIKTKGVDAIKKKIHALRSQHCGERMKIKKRKSGSGAADNYKPKWEFFTALNFLFRDAGSVGSVVDSMNLDEGSRGNLPEGFVDDDVEMMVPEPYNPGKGKRHKNHHTVSLNSSAASKSQSDVPNDKDRILTNFVFSSLKTMKPEAASRLRKKIKLIILEEMVTEIEPQNDDDHYSV